MVNSALMPPADVEVALALGYAPAGAREALIALWALDARLASILRTTTEPMVGQLRLTWWHEALGAVAPPGGEPVLAALRAAGVAMPPLRRIVEGWEALLEEPDDRTLAAYADGRGGGLFAAAARILSAREAPDAAGAGWALVDLARHHSSPAVGRLALRLARQRLDRAPARWSRAGRPLGALAKLAARDLDGPEPQGSPRRVLAAAWLALTGR